MLRQCHVIKVDPLSTSEEFMVIYFVVAYCNFYGKNGATSWCHAHGDVMSPININKYKMVEQ